MVSNAAQEREVWVQPVLEGMSERDILEGYSPEQLLDYKSFLLDKYSDLERQVHLVNDILDGYGHVGETTEGDNVILGEN